MRRVITPLSLSLSLNGSEIRWAAQRTLVGPDPLCEFTVSSTVSSGNPYLRPYLRKYCIFDRIFHKTSTVLYLRRIVDRIFDRIFHKTFTVHCICIFAVSSTVSSYFDRKSIRRLLCLFSHKSQIP